MGRIRVGAAIFLAAAAAAAASTPTAAAAPPALAWSAAAKPFLLTFSRDGAPLVAESGLAGEPGGRLGYRLADGSFHSLGALLGRAAIPGGDEYRVATDEPGRTAVVDVATTPTGARVSLALSPAEGVVETFEAFAPRPGEHFLGGGERPAPLDLVGQSVQVKASYACSTSMPAPFFLSSAGYGISLRTTAVARMAFPGATLADACAAGPEPPCPLAPALAAVQLCAKTPTLSYDVFAGTPEQVVSAYTATTGRPLLPPTSQFELIKWRDIVSGTAQVLEDAQRLQALHVPIGWVLLDNPWESNLCYGTLTFDAERFPDPAAMIAALHARGVRLMLWISPLARRQWCPPPAQYPASALFPSGNAWTLDLTDPGVRTTFETGLRALIALGVDGFKGDRGDEADLESSQLAGGPGVLLHNAYPLVYERAVAEAIAAADKAGSFATIFRTGAPGSSTTVSGFWAGDQPGTFAGLAAAIRDGLSAGVAGYPIWGSDTGGYDSTGLTPEVFVRWAQLSAVSPVFEVGGAGPNATFWDFGDPTVELLREAAVLHYELFPYLYGLAGLAHVTGVPILRPLALEYPQDASAWQADLELLVGPDLLAAPVTVPAPTAGVAQPQVYLPAGRWLDLATGGAVAGGGAPFARPTPLDQLPLYLRAGAAIPFAARTPLLWAKPWPTDAVALPGRGGWLYAPAQGTTVRADAAFGRFHAVVRGARLELRLRGAPSQTQVLLAGVARPLSVRIDGAPVPARPAAALRRAAQGWTAATAPFPGVVLKLAPRRGGVTVDVVLRRAV